MYRWNEDKNSILKSTRGYSFEDVVRIISQEGVLDHYKHPLKDKYPNQYIYVVLIEGYVYYVPYVPDGEDIFLKNIIPSRKLHKQYKGETS